MRTLVLTLFIALLSTSTYAQRKGSNNINTPMERNLYELSNAINTTVNSKMTPENKDLRVRKAIHNYMMISQADEIMSTSDCDHLTIKAYLHDLQMQNFDEVPSSYIQKMGNIKTDCALRHAVELYEMVGHNLESSDQLCNVMGCDDLVNKRPAQGRSTRNTQHRNDRNTVQPGANAQTKWKYTGVKRYFVEKEKYGWRYLCIESDSRGNTKLSQEQIEKALAELDKNIAAAAESGTSTSGSIELPTPLKGAKLSWKLDNQVDIW